MKKKRRLYDAADRAAALAALAANGGKIRQTARQLHISEATLRSWHSGDRPPPRADECAQKKADLADRMEEIARQLLDEVTPTKIGLANVQQLLVSAGVAIDKMRLLRNEPTENVAVLVIVEEIVDAAPA